KNGSVHSLLCTDREILPSKGAWQECRAHLGRPKVFWTARMQKYRMDLKKKEKEKKKDDSIRAVESEMDGRIGRSAGTQSFFPHEPLCLRHIETNKSSLHHQYVFS
ncbi:hypothetical protein, partial [Escherichia coli]|uniref:hypothetical protein n=1 Tax=Escherichia coli TaxID=562 RepID=UPI001BFBFD6B